MVYKTSDNNFGTAKFIVDSVAGQGTHTTITAALADASSGETIFIRPGTYTENLTLKAGVDIVSFSGEGITPNVTIVGKLSASFAGSCSISGIRLKTHGAAFLEVSGSSATIVNLNNCYLDSNDATGITYSSSSSNSRLNFSYCAGDIETTGITLYSQSSPGTQTYRYCNISNTGGSSTIANTSAGTISYHYCQINFPISTSSTGFFTANFSGFNTLGLSVTAFTSGGSTGSPNANNCQFVGGTAPGIVIDTFLASRNNTVFSSNAAAVSGAGTLHLGSILFSSTSSTITCTVVNDLITTIGQVNIGNFTKILSGSGSPSGSVTAPKGSLFLRTDGSSTSTRAYINTNGGTTWTAITTVA